VTVVVIRNTPSGPAVAYEEAGNRLIVCGHYHVGIGNAPSDSAITAKLMEALRVKFFRESERVQGQLVERRKIARDLLGGGSLELVPDLPTFDTAEALEFFDNVGLFRLEMAIRGLCADATVKNILRENLKKAVFHNVKRETDTRFDFVNGVYECWQVYDRAQSGSARIISNLELEELFCQKLPLRESVKKKNLVESVFPERTKELAELVGQNVEYDVDWSSFKTDDEYNFLDNCACHRINMALRCMDPAVKSALQKLPLKRVRLACVRTPAEKKLLLDKSAGALCVTCAFGSGLSGCFSDGEIASELAKAK